MDTFQFPPIPDIQVLPDQAIEVDHDTAMFISTSTSRNKRYQTSFLPETIEYVKNQLRLVKRREWQRRYRKTEEFKEKRRQSEHIILLIFYFCYFYTIDVLLVNCLSQHFQRKMSLEKCYLLQTVFLIYPNRGLMVESFVIVQDITENLL